ncbi:MAG TPA: TonB-dependent receptor, partial [Arachidicoccus sp.]
MGKQLIKSLFILSLFTAFITNVHANYTAKDNGSIKGKIVSDDGTPVENASVRLKETSKHTLSNANGFFELNNVPSGTYKLTVSSVGYKAYQQSISVGASDDTLIITLKASAGELSDVSILSGINKFNKKETDDVARLPLKNIENPQVYSVIPKEIISEQMVTDYNSVFKNVPGAGVPVVYNQGRSTLLSRGFVTANYIRNSISGFVFTSVDPANLEVLEAIKGPSGTLFNSSQTSFGGLFNRVTKKPFDGDRTELSYTGGGNSLNRITFDINHPLDSNKTVLMRINGALHTEQSFQDFGFTKSMMIAPSFVYKVNDRLNFLFDIEASTFNATSPIRFAPYTKGSIHNIKDLGMDYKKSFTNNSLDYTTQQLNIYGQINYKISDKWKLQTNLTRTYSTTKGFVTMLTAKSDNTLQQSIQNENYPYNGVEVQQNIIGDFKIGSLRNRIVAGIDYYNQRSDRSTPTDTMPVINFRNPGAAYYNFN